VVDTAPQLGSPAFCLQIISDPDQFTVSGAPVVPNGRGAVQPPAGSGFRTSISETDASFHPLSAHQAHLWGIKAAQEGIPISCNPYRNPQSRAAWEAGHRKDIFAEQAHRPAFAFD
jgi:hypothetical protein